MNREDNYLPPNCPVCQGEYSITKVTCKNCNSELTGRFKQNKLASLSPRNMEFAEVFIKNRGNIKDIEKELGISYPTVRSMIDALVEQLESISGKHYSKREKVVDVKKEQKKSEILDLLENGSINSSEAIKMINNL